MTNIIMCGHGQLAIAMKESVEMIYGDVQNLTVLSFEKSENREVLVEKMRRSLNHDDDTLIVVDLFGGSPYNAAAELAFRYSNVELITGMSLPLCLELFDNIEDLNAKQLANYLIEVGQQCVKKFDKEAIQNNQEDDLL